MKADDPLLRILACPLDKGPLHLLASDPGTGRDEALYNPRLRRRYPVVDGIPQLLPSSGEQVLEDEHEELLAVMSPEPDGPARSTAPGATP
ncbi:Trm112 family protein [Streptomyces sp. NPDC005931]|uniref:Trm112 family protein n=1 Tax=Streptomyces sp. NPDC005931 TaxID=3364737 RepID=UPI0036B432A9